MTEKIEKMPCINQKNGNQLKKQTDQLRSEGEDTSQDFKKDRVRSTQALVFTPDPQEPKYFTYFIT